MPLPASLTDRGAKLSPLHHNLSIKDFYTKRNKILILRRYGGLGDIMMMRMMFEDFKKQLPESHLVFACPAQYMSAVEDHPYLDEVIDVESINMEDYVISYDISTACGKYEMTKAPLADKNRSDIWAEHCGVQLKNHNMHLSVSPSLTKYCRSKLEQYKEHSKIVLLCPISAMVSKNLNPEQMNGLLEELEDECTIVGMHKDPIPGLNRVTIIPKDVKEYIAFINAADYIITVDTASFHIAGGLNKPQVAIFSWADGKVYGKWYSKFILVQRHRDDGNWDCGPCYVWTQCSKCKTPGPKPCITEITSTEIVQATREIMRKW